MVASDDYRRTFHRQLPELGQVVDDGVQDYRDDEVTRAVFVPARIYLSSLRQVMALQIFKLHKYSVLLKC